MLQTFDYVKAAIAAIVIFAANIAISFAVMAVYAYFINTGHDAAFYNAAAQRIAPWSSIVFGAVLFYAVAFLLGKRRPERNAIAFALTIFLVYAGIEFVVMSDAGKLASMIGVIALSLATKLTAAYLGARSVRLAQ